jgi:adenosylhomocysteine nucleosidase
LRNPASKIAVLLLLAAGSIHAKDPRFAVLISARAEWRVVKPLYPAAGVHQSPYGEYFFATLDRERVLFFQGGWGKVSAAASTQYVVDHFHPAHLINLGTCGGVEGRIQRFDVVAPEKVVIYDIDESMGDAAAAIARYTTTLQLPARLPVPVQRVTMYSADRDLTPAVLREIDTRFQPVVADWESGAIAWVAQKNGVPLLILRGVTDLVGRQFGEAQGNMALFEKNTERVMRGLVADLPRWIDTLKSRPD